MKKHGIYIYTHIVYNNLAQASTDKGAEMLPTFHAAVPHLIEPTKADPWINDLLVASLVVQGFDKIADKIPGVKDINRLPQILALLQVAVTFDILSSVRIISDGRKVFVKLVESWGVAGWFYNLGVIAVILAIAAFFAARYMGMSLGEKVSFLPSKGAENIFWDGILFGLTLSTGAVVAPWLADVLEFLRYSLFNLFQAIFIGTLNWLGQRGVQ